MKAEPARGWAIFVKSGRGLRTRWHIAVTTVRRTRADAIAVWGRTYYYRMLRDGLVVARRVEIQAEET